MSISALERHNQTEEAKAMAEFLEKIHDRTRVEEIEREFPCLLPFLGQRAATTYFMNLADNRAGTFKPRGAFAASSVAKQEGAKKVGTFSAGNHSAGLAVAARELELDLCIYMPETAPLSKQLKPYEIGPNGTTVHLRGNTLEEAREAYLDENPENTVFIPPYDSEDTMRGTEHIGYDLLQRHPEVKRVVLVPGGAGLVGGLSTAFRTVGRTDIEIVLAQGEGSDSLQKSVHAKKVEAGTLPNTKFGGSAVAVIGEECLKRVLLYPEDKLTFQTIEDQHMVQLIEMYVTQNEELMRFDIPMFEPTALLAVGAMIKCIKDDQRKKRTVNTVVLGTGTNQHPLDIHGASTNPKEVIDAKYHHLLD